MSRLFGRKNNNNNNGGGAPPPTMDDIAGNFADVLNEEKEEEEDGRFRDEEDDDDETERAPAEPYKRTSYGRRNRKTYIIVGAIVLAILVLGGIGATVGILLTRNNDDNDPEENAIAFMPSLSPSHVPMLGWIQRGATLEGSSSLDMFGRSVCISIDGNIVAVGASGRNKRGYVRAYVSFRNGWMQIGSDILGQTAMSDFGWSCSLSSDGLRLAVGDYSDNRVRVFDFNGTEWLRVGNDIEGTAPNDSNGWDVSLSGDGNVLAVGAPNNDGGGNQAGHVRVFRWNNDNTAWVQVGQDIRGEAVADESGKSLSMSNDGTIVAVGARRNDGNDNNNAGHVRVWRYDGFGWLQYGQDLDGTAAGDESGWTSDMNGDGTVVAIGAHNHEGEAGVRSGEVRVFRYNNTSWMPMGQTLLGESQNGEFGYAVSLSQDGRRLAVGIRSNNNNIFETRVGSVRVFMFDDDDGSWIQIGSDIDGLMRGDLFGQSVALSGTGETLVVGASNEANGGPGYAIVYDIGFVERPVAVPSASQMPSTSLIPSTIPSISPTTLS